MLFLLAVTSEPFLVRFAQIGNKYGFSYRFGRREGVTGLYPGREGCLATLVFE